MQPDQDNQKNMMLAIALSLAVLLGWQFLYALPRQKAEQELRQAQQKNGQITQQGVQNPGGLQQPGQPAGRPAAPVQGIAREAALALAPRHAITTPSLVGSVNLRGGFIDDLRLVRYRETVAPTSPTVVLLSPAAAQDAYFAEYGWLPGAGTVSAADLPNADTLWTAAKSVPLTAESPLVLTWNNGKGLTFRRTISLDDRYMFTVKDEVENRTGQQLALTPYGRIYRLGTPKVEGWAILHEGLIGFLGAEKLHEITYYDLTKEAEANAKARRPLESQKAFKPVKGGWLGFTDKYWAAALVPPQTADFEPSFHTIGKTAAQRELFWVNYQLAPVSIAPGGTGLSEANLFAGAKQPKIIDSYGSSLNITRFDLMVDWGWFYFITKPLYWLIDKLYVLFGNFGLAILAVTVLVKAAFYPLANKSYESMAKMKKMQPEIQDIQARLKDNRQAQQQELMKLYQKHKINPASGCLPVLLQIPVFFALYKVLFVAIDMRHAPFIGWIKDLSAADPTSLFNLFGLLPYDPGAIPLIGELLKIGVWPILMGITMYVQMQLNPPQPDPMQQRIFNLMPVFFPFLMAGFPAGLVIYWTWSNVLSFLQQYHINRKNGAEVHLWKNLGIEKLVHQLAERINGRRKL